MGLAWLLLSCQSVSLGKTEQGRLTKVSHSESATGSRGALAIALVVAAAFSFSAAAEDRDQSGFLGLWEGVDRLDGSTVRVSITNVDDDYDDLEILWREGFFTVCFEVGAGYSLGRGLITGEGRFVASDVLNVETTLTCINDVNEPAEPEKNSFIFRLDDRVLVIHGDDEFPDLLLSRVAR